MASTIITNIIIFVIHIEQKISKAIPKVIHSVTNYIIIILQAFMQYDLNWVKV